MAQVVNPADGRILAEFDDAAPAAIGAAYQRARRAQPAWAATPLEQRLACMQRLREAVVHDAERLAAVLCAEVGKPIRQARNELTGLLARIDFFVEHAPSTLARRTLNDASGGGGSGLREEITHQALGVIANISAWNYPYFVGANVFIPALLAGNCVLYKPSEFALLSGIEIGRLLHGAGIPPDVFQVILGGGASGAALVAAPVDGVFFTGSHATGVRIAEAVAPRLIKLQLELGGKDPAYVCDDVDIAAAAASTADGAMYNAGQSCCAVERIYVHQRIHDRFVDAFLAEVRQLRLGDPAADDTTLGPLTRPAQLAVLQAQVADALAKGARLLAGGRRVERPGNWFEPTVLVDVDHTMSLMRDESFGPVIGIQSVADDAQAVRLMNDTEYGLTAAVYSRDGARAHAVLDQVRSGSAYWNCCDRVSPRLPWTGVGHSGLGVTLSTYGIETFTRPRAWHLRGA